MASLTFPLPLSAFQDTFTIAEFQMEVVEPVQATQLADGTVIRASLGEALWQGTFRLAVATHADAAAAEGVLALATRPGASVLLYDPRTPGPRQDVNGAVLGSSTPTLQAVAADRREISIAGLPSAYVLSRGDLLAFTYSSNPTRYALHRVVTGATATGLGLASDIEVIPAIRTGYSLGAAINLLKPTMKAVIKAVGAGAGRPVITDGAIVEFVQTLR